MLTAYSIFSFFLPKLISQPHFKPSHNSIIVLQILMPLSKLFNTIILYINPQIQIVCFFLVSLVMVLLEDMHGSMDEEALEERPQPSLSAVFPNELIVEIFSRLSVKPLMKFRCLNNSFKTLISDPDFVQKHLKKSARNPHLPITSFLNSENISVYEVLTFPVSQLLENPSTTTIHYDHFIRLTRNDDGTWFVVGSCNGLICLISIHISRLCLWNPSTRRKSEFFLPSSYNYYFLYSFGYHTLTETYKVVALRIQKEHGSAAGSMVKVFSLGNSSSRNIQCFYVIPLYWFHNFSNNVVYLSGDTINWLAVHNYFGSDF